MKISQEYRLIKSEIKFKIFIELFICRFNFNTIFFYFISKMLKLTQNNY